MTNIPEPGQHDFVLTPENKPAVKTWLIAQGIDPARVEKMRKESLQNAYRYPQYLRAMLLRRDYTNGDQPCQTTINTDIGAKAGETASPEPMAAIPTCTIPTIPTSKSDGGSMDGKTAIIETTTILTEARVIELIREHAIPILIQRLQLGEL